MPDSPTDTSEVPSHLPSGWRRLRLLLEWDGTAYHGWQAQSQGEQTIQGVLENALEPLGLFSRPMAAGRTDAGVHALEMPVHLDVGFGLAPESILKALNARLPPDVRVLFCAESNPNFHARFSCHWRSYVYRILNTPTASALERNRALWIPQRLEVAPMRHAAQHLVGRFDFAAFATKEERQTEREVLSCEVRAVPAPFSRGQEAIEIHIVGESFLRHMVRGIVGTLLEVGSGKLSSSDVLRVLESKDRGMAGPNVPPHGLYFFKAGYRPWQDR
ncbi:MAG: tRNA pseudouridine(38-40) synthase TruA [Deinococcales bacterium]